VLTQLEKGLATYGTKPAQHPNDGANPRRQPRG
jgi:hypothetical protein